MRCMGTCIKNERGGERQYLLVRTNQVCVPQREKAREIWKGKEKREQERERDRHKQEREKKLERDNISGRKNIFLRYLRNSVVYPSGARWRRKTHRLCLRNVWAEAHHRHAYKVVAKVPRRWAYSGLESAAAAHPTSYMNGVMHRDNESTMLQVGKVTFVYLTLEWVTSHTFV